MSTYKSAGHAAALIRELTHILHYHVQVVVKASQTAVKLLLTLHEDPEVAADALVDHF